MEQISLFLDEDNELLFKVTVEGTRPGKSSCRLIVEGPDINYMLEGKFVSSDEVSIIIPPLAKNLSEGVYNTRLEVLVDDRIFIPLKMNANFEKSVSVVAEAVLPKTTRSKKISTTASLVSSHKPHSKTGASINEKNKRVIRSEKELYNLIKSALGSTKI